MFGDAPEVVVVVVVQIGDTVVLVVVPTSMVELLLYTYVPLIAFLCLHVARPKCCVVLVDVVGLLKVDTGYTESSFSRTVRYLHRQRRKGITNLWFLLLFNYVSESLSSRIARFRTFIGSEHNI